MLRSIGSKIDEHVEDEKNDDTTTISWSIGPNPFSTVGPIMFNFAFIVTAPPLSALAKRQQIASDALGMSCVVMGVLYAIIGWVGAPVSKAVENGLIASGDDTNLLSLILLSGGEDGISTLDLICISAFGTSILASIPVYCLLAQQTLVYDAGVSHFPAFIFSNVVPWMLVALTYNAAFFEAFVNWSGLLILGYANFSLPLLLDSRLQKVRSTKSVSNAMSLDDCMSSEKELIVTVGNDPVTGVNNVVFCLVTASISSVIAFSAIPSLSFAVLVFVGILVSIKLWPETSLEM